MIKKLISLLIVCLPGVALAAEDITLADPTIFLEDGIYYLYGTSSPDGILVYTSTDLEYWDGPAGATDGHALKRGDAWGTKGFWAPQVFKRDGKYFMAYTANEQIAIAESDSPLGPFRQETPQHLPASMHQIDPYVFFDDDGKIYLYHVRLQDGNRIFVVELDDDLRTVKEETAKECISAMPGTWEDTWNADWTVAEGPTVVRRDTDGTPLYYLLYSCNDYRNPDYAVGYATAPTPYGPWQRYEANPIISTANVGCNGPGHGDLFTDKDGNLRYVFHVHHDVRSANPRKTLIAPVYWDAGILSVGTGTTAGIHPVTLSAPSAPDGWREACPKVP